MYGLAATNHGIRWAFAPFSRLPKPMLGMDSLYSAHVKTAKIKENRVIYSLIVWGSRETIQYGSENVP